MATDSQAIKELHDAVKVQKAAFLKDQAPTLETRVGNLHKLAGMMMEHREEIRQAMQSDFASHPYGASDLIECLGVAGRAMFVAGQLPEWLKDEERAIDPQVYGNATAVVHREPKGVVGVLVPFNFPFDLSCGPLVEILAGGNRALFKPSEFTPECGKLLKKMLNKTFSPDLVDVVLGGVELGIEFSKVRWDHLLYTGSPEVGKLVGAEAAKRLVPCTLELGGKCPAIIDQGKCDQETVETILGVKLLKNGQMCVSVDYVLVHENDADTFVQAAKKYMASLNGYSTSSDCTGIITEKHLERILSLLDEATSAGANVISLEPDAKVDHATRRMPLSLVVDPDSNLRLSKEEIFGPILPVWTYKTLDAAIERVNEGERPLALYVFSQDDKVVDHVVNQTKSGGVSVNACALQAALPSLGFGGTGQSGIGRHHGLEGFREFTNPKGIVRRGTAPDLVKAFAPPYAFAVAIADHAFAEAAKGAAVPEGLTTA